jgi:hypothetical protein
MLILAVSKRNWRVPLLATALLLPAVSSAQWPEDYDDNSDIDVAIATAADRWGNVYVAGTVSSNGSGKDFFLRSYTASGVPRTGWDKRYDNPNHSGSSSHDIATSIHVDSDGNVYVAGTSKNSSGNYDFVVVRYDPSGGTPWAGMTGGTGYTFDSAGAVRTTSSDNEGILGDPPPTGTAEEHVAMAVRESFDPADRIIGVTGVFGGGSVTESWRTIVFEPDPNQVGGVRIKSGWPVDYPNQYDNGHPNAIAIYTDNSIYVTGFTHDSSIPAEWITTVRFKPQGGSGSGAIIWEHYFSPFGGKPNRGQDIVLDRDGNAYVCGIGTNVGNTTSKYVTLRLNKDPVLNTTNGDKKWDMSYDNGVSGLHLASSIDLTFEVVSGQIK